MSAISIALDLDDWAANNLTEYEFTGYDPSDNVPCYVAVTSAREGASSPVIPTLTHSGVTTFDQVATVVAADGNSRLTVFRFLEASPGSATLTVNFGSDTQTHCAVMCVAVTNVAVPGANGINADNSFFNGDTDAPGSSTTVSMALDNFDDAVNNATLLFVGSSDGRTFTDEAGWTDLSGVGQDIGFGAYLSGEDTTPTATITAAVQLTAIAFEVFEDLPSEPFLKVRFDPA